MYTPARGCEWSMAKYAPFPKRRSGPGSASSCPREGDLQTLSPSYVTYSDFDDQSDGRSRCTARRSTAHYGRPAPEDMVYIKCRSNAPAKSEQRPQPVPPQSRKTNSEMSTTRRPYFIIVGLPADDKSMQDLDVKQLFHTKPEEVRHGLEAMQKSLKDNGFDFDCRCSQTVNTGMTS